MILVPDANTLIYLAKADLLEALDDAELWVGARVFEEAVERGKELGHADAYLLDRYLDGRPVEQPSAKEADRFDEEMAYFGGAGETEVFLLAQRSEEALVITSDGGAYKKLRRRGVDVRRTDMLLFGQFEQGDLTEGELYDRLTALRRVHGTTDQRIAFLMEKAREGDRQ